MSNTMVQVACENYGRKFRLTFASTSMILLVQTLVLRIIHLIAVIVE